MKNLITKCAFVAILAASSIGAVAASANGNASASASAKCCADTAKCCADGKCAKCIAK